MKRLVLITLGGTISAKGKNRLDLKDYKSGLIDGSYYLEDIPELKRYAQIDIITLDSISSTLIDWHHWVKLKQMLEELLNEQNYDGAIISHGTNTLEETAYFLHLTVNTMKPIVLVGAQRPYTALSSDAQLNLLHAVKVAANLESHNKGVLVVFNGKIHSARDVTKVDTYNVDGFDSGDMGCLGYVDAAHDIVYYRAPMRKHTTNSAFNNLKITNFPTVEIVYSYAGATGDLINYITESGKYEGIVIAGTGAGRFSKNEEKAIEKSVQKGLHVVRSSRVGSGRVLSIEPFEHLDLIHGDNLNPQKARILLGLSILSTNEREEIQEMFELY